MMWDVGTGVHWWGWVLGSSATLTFLALVIWSIVALVSEARQPHPRADTGATKPAGTNRRAGASDVSGIDNNTVIDQSFRKPALRPQFGRLYYW